jgi:hypothetical protein
MYFLLRHTFDWRDVLQALGGGVAIVVGACVFNSAGPRVELNYKVSDTSMRDSQTFLVQIRFTNCTAKSLSSGPDSASSGSSSVFGGAVAIVQKTQSSLFQQQNLLSVFVSNSSGSNFTILFVNSSFVGCLAKTSSLSVRSGSTSAGGGAVYVHSSAIYNFTAKHSTFESNSVENNCGAKESITLSSGGALVVETPSSTESVVYISWCTFLKCSAVGAFLNTVAVQAGALAVASASIVSIEHSQFLNCSIQAALESSDLESGLDSLEFEGSGGAGASLSFARNILIIRCVFDATGGSDASETSSGLLILFSHSFPSHVHVQDSVMKGSQVLLGVYCANQLDFSAIVCPPEGLQLSVQNSSLIQVLPQNFSQDDFMIGNHVIALQRGVSSSFGRVLVQCENDGYAVLKNLSERLSILKYSCKPCLPFQVARSSNEVWIEDVASRVEAGVCVLELPCRPFTLPNIR